MPEKDQNLEWNLDVSELSSLSLDDESLIDEVLEEKGDDNNLDLSASSTNDESSVSSSIDESVFLDAWDSWVKKNVLKDGENFWSYLRWFFFASILTLLWVVAIVLLYTFSGYIKEASQVKVDPDRQEYLQKYKEKFQRVKSKIWMKNSYVAPVVWSDQEQSAVDEIINATDIDFIEKKDLLSNYAADLMRRTNDRADYAENLKQEIARQLFLPEELEWLLSKDQAIDTIQRSLNALEVIKFSTATKVFSYMNTALATIAEMIRVGWANVESLHDLFVKLSSRWEKDISSYVYMCYLNPFEVDANCDAIWDLDLYYNIINDNSINIRLFNNALNAISQLLEKWDTSLFSITFNWFNAEDKNIQFNIEVYTNQEDERALLQQGKRNPNIFILTNIINLLKQSSFIIWSEINTKEVKVDTKMINQWGISRPVNYSTMDFTVPIQKDTEREIFDYIDLESMKKLLTDRWFKEDLEEFEESQASLEKNSIVSIDENEIDMEQEYLENQQWEEEQLEEDLNENLD